MSGECYAGHDGSASFRSSSTSCCSSLSMNVLNGGCPPFDPEELSTVTCNSNYCFPKDKTYFLKEDKRKWTESVDEADDSNHSSNSELDLRLPLYLLERQSPINSCQCKFPSWNMSHASQYMSSLENIQGNSRFFHNSVEVDTVPSAESSSDSYLWYGDPTNNCTQYSTTTLHKYAGACSEMRDTHCSWFQQQGQNDASQQLAAEKQIKNLPCVCGTLTSSYTAGKPNKVIEVLPCNFGPPDILTVSPLCLPPDGVSEISMDSDVDGRYSTYTGWSKHTCNGMRAPFKKSSGIREGFVLRSLLTPVKMFTKGKNTSDNYLSKRDSFSCKMGCPPTRLVADQPSCTSTPVHRRRHLEVSTTPIPINRCKSVLPSSTSGFLIPAPPQPLINPVASPATVTRTVVYTSKNDTEVSAPIHVEVVHTVTPTSGKDKVLKQKASVKGSRKHLREKVAHRLDFQSENCVQKMTSRNTTAASYMEQSYPFRCRNKTASAKIHNKLVYVDMNELLEQCQGYETRPNWENLYGNKVESSVNTHRQNSHSKTMRRTLSDERPDLDHTQLGKRTTSWPESIQNRVSKDGPNKESADAVQSWNEGNVTPVKLEKNAWSVSRFCSQMDLLTPSRTPRSCCEDDCVFHCERQLLQMPTRPSCSELTDDLIPHCYDSRCSPGRTFNYSSHSHNCCKSPQSHSVQIERNISTPNEGCNFAEKYFIADHANLSFVEHLTHASECEGENVKPRQKRLHFTATENERSPYLATKPTKPQKSWHGQGMTIDYRYVASFRGMGRRSWSDTCVAENYPVPSFVMLASSKNPLSGIARMTSGADRVSRRRGTPSPESKRRNKPSRTANVRLRKERSTTSRNKEKSERERKKSANPKRRKSLPPSQRSSVEQVPDDDGSTETYCCGLKKRRKVGPTGTPYEDFTAAETGSVDEESLPRSESSEEPQQNGRPNEPERDDEPQQRSGYFKLNVEDSRHQSRSARPINKKFHDGERYVRNFKDDSRPRARSDTPIHDEQQEVSEKQKKDESRQQSLFDKAVEKVPQPQSRPDTPIINEPQQRHQGSNRSLQKDPQHQQGANRPVDKNPQKQVPSDRPFNAVHQQQFNPLMSDDSLYPHATQNRGPVQPSTDVNILTSRVSAPFDYPSHIPPMTAKSDAWQQTSRGDLSFKLQPSQFQSGDILPPFYLAPRATDRNKSVQVNPASVEDRNKRKKKKNPDDEQKDPDDEEKYSDDEKDSDDEEDAVLEKWTPDQGSKKSDASKKSPRKDKGEKGSGLSDYASYPESNDENTTETPETSNASRSKTKEKTESNSPETLSTTKTKEPTASGAGTYKSKPHSNAYSNTYSNQNSRLSGKSKKSNVYSNTYSNPYSRSSGKSKKSSKLKEHKSQKSRNKSKKSKKERRKKSQECLTIGSDGQVISENDSDAKKRQRSRCKEEKHRRGDSSASDSQEDDYDKGDSYGESRSKSRDESHKKGESHNSRRRSRGQSHEKDDSSKAKSKARSQSPSNSVDQSNSDSQEDSQSRSRSTSRSSSKRRESTPNKSKTGGSSKSRRSSQKYNGSSEEYYSSSKSRKKGRSKSRSKKDDSCTESSAETSEVECRVVAPWKMIKRCRSESPVVRQPVAEVRVLNISPKWAVKGTQSKSLPPTPTPQVKTIKVSDDNPMQFEIVVETKEPPPSKMRNKEERKDAECEAIRTEFNNFQQPMANKAVKSRGFPTYFLVSSDEFLKHRRLLVPEEEFLESVVSGIKDQALENEANEELDKKPVTRLTCTPVVSNEIEGIKMICKETQYQSKANCSVNKDKLHQAGKQKKHVEASTKGRTKSRMLLACTCRVCKPSAHTEDLSPTDSHPERDPTEAYVVLDSSSSSSSICSNSDCSCHRDHLQDISEHSELLEYGDLGELQDIYSKKNENKRERGSGCNSVSHPNRGKPLKKQCKKSHAHHLHPHRNNGIPTGFPAVPDLMSRLAFLVCPLYSSNHDGANSFQAPCVVGSNIRSSRKKLNHCNLLQNNRPNCRGMSSLKKKSKSCTTIKSTPLLTFCETQRLSTGYDPQQSMFCKGKSGLANKDKNRFGLSKQVYGCHEDDVKLNFVCGTQKQASPIKVSKHRYAGRKHRKHHTKRLSQKGEAAKKLGLGLSPRRTPPLYYVPKRKSSKVRTGVGLKCVQPEVACCQGNTGFIPTVRRVCSTGSLPNMCAGMGRNTPKDPSLKTGPWLPYVNKTEISPKKPYLVPRYVRRCPCELPAGPSPAKPVDYATQLLNAEVPRGILCGAPISPPPIGMCCGSCTPDPVRSSTPAFCAIRSLWQTQKCTTDTHADYMRGPPTHIVPNCPPNTMVPIKCLATAKASKVCCDQCNSPYWINTLPEKACRELKYITSSSCEATPPCSPPPPCQLRTTCIPETVCPCQSQSTSPCAPQPVCPCQPQPSCMRHLSLVSFTPCVAPLGDDNVTNCLWESEMLCGQGNLCEANSRAKCGEDRNYASLSQCQQVTRCRSHHESVCIPNPELPCVYKCIECDPVCFASCALETENLLNPETSLVYQEKKKKRTACSSPSPNREKKEAVCILIDSIAEACSVTRISKPAISMRQLTKEQNDLGFFTAIESCQEYAKEPSAILDQSQILDACLQDAMRQSRNMQTCTEEIMCLSRTTSPVQSMQLVRSVSKIHVEKCCSPLAFSGNVTQVTDPHSTCQNMPLCYADSLISSTAGGSCSNGPSPGDVFFELVKKLLSCSSQKSSSISQNLYVPCPCRPRYKQKNRCALQTSSGRHKRYAKPIPKIPEPRSTVPSMVLNPCALSERPCGIYPGPIQEIDSLFQTSSQTDKTPPKIHACTDWQPNINPCATDKTSRTMSQRRSIEMLQQSKNLRKEKITCHRKTEVVICSGNVSKVKHASPPPCLRKTCRLSSPPHSPCSMGLTEQTLYPSCSPMSAISPCPSKTAKLPGPTCGSKVPKPIPIRPKSPCSVIAEEEITNSVVCIPSDQSSFTPRNDFLAKKLPPPLPVCIPRIIIPKSESLARLSLVSKETAAPTEKELTSTCHSVSGDETCTCLPTTTEPTTACSVLNSSHEDNFVCVPRTVPATQKDHVLPRLSVISGIGEPVISPTLVSQTIPPSRKRPCEHPKYLASNLCTVHSSQQSVCEQPKSPPCILRTVVSTQKSLQEQPISPALAVPSLHNNSSGKLKSSACVLQTVLSSQKGRRESADVCVENNSRIVAMTCKNETIDSPPCGPVSVPRIIPQSLATCPRTIGRLSPCQVNVPYVGHLGSTTVPYLTSSTTSLTSHSMGAYCQCHPKCKSSSDRTSYLAQPICWDSCADQEVGNLVNSDVCEIPEECCEMSDCISPSTQSDIPNLFDQLLDKLCRCLYVSKTKSMPNLACEAPATASSCKLPCMSRTNHFTFDKETAEESDSMFCRCYDTMTEDTSCDENCPYRYMSYDNSGSMQYDPSVVSMMEPVCSECMGNFSVSEDRSSPAEDCTCTDTLPSTQNSNAENKTVESSVSNSCVCANCLHHKNQRLKAGMVRKTCQADVTEKCYKKSHRTGTKKNDTSCNIPSPAPGFVVKLSSGNVADTSSACVANPPVPRNRIIHRSPKKRPNDCCSTRECDTNHTSVGVQTEFIVSRTHLCQHCHKLKSRIALPRVHGKRRSGLPRPKVRTSREPRLAEVCGFPKLPKVPACKEVTEVKDPSPPTVPHSAPKGKQKEFRDVLPESRPQILLPQSIVAIESKPPQCFDQGLLEQDASCCLSRVPTHDVLCVVPRVDKINSKPEFSFPFLGQKPKEACDVVCVVPRADNINSKSDYCCPFIGQKPKEVSLSGVSPVLTPRVGETSSFVKSCKNGRPEKRCSLTGKLCETPVDINQNSCKPQIVCRNVNERVVLRNPPQQFQNDCCQECAPCGAATPFTETEICCGMQSQSASYYVISPASPRTCEEDDDLAKCMATCQGKPCVPRTIRKQLKPAPQSGSCFKKKVRQSRREEWDPSCQLPCHLQESRTPALRTLPCHQKFTGMEECCNTVDLQCPQSMCTTTPTQRCSVTLLPLSADACNQPYRDYCRNTFPNAASPSHLCTPCGCPQQPSADLCTHDQSNSNRYGLVLATKCPSCCRREQKRPRKPVRKCSQAGCVVYGPNVQLLRQKVDYNKPLPPPSVVYLPPPLGKQCSSRDIPEDTECKPWWRFPKLRLCSGGGGEKPPPFPSSSAKDPSFRCIERTLPEKKCSLTTTPPVIPPCPEAAHSNYQKRPDISYSLSASMTNPVPCKSSIPDRATCCNPHQSPVPARKCSLTGAEDGMYNPSSSYQPPTCCNPEKKCSLTGAMDRPDPMHPVFNPYPTYQPPSHVNPYFNQPPPASYIMPPPTYRPPTYVMPPLHSPSCPCGVPTSPCPFSVPQVPCSCNAPTPPCGCMAQEPPPIQAPHLPSCSCDPDDPCRVLRRLPCPPSTQRSVSVNTTNTEDAGTIADESFGYGSSMNSPHNYASRLTQTDQATSSKKDLSKGSDNSESDEKYKKAKKLKKEGADSPPKVEKSGSKTSKDEKDSKASKEEKDSKASKEGEAS